MSSHRRSVNRPFPSSPHWVPTITVPGTTAPSEEPLVSRGGSVLNGIPFRPGSALASRPAKESRSRIPEQLLVERDGDDLAAGRAHLLAGEPLDHGDGHRARLDQAGLEQG